MVVADLEDMLEIFVWTWPFKKLKLVGLVWLFAVIQITSELLVITLCKLYDSFFPLVILEQSRQGMIGISMTNSRKLVVPTRAAPPPAIGTNPICCSAPGITDTFTLDMATSTGCEYPDGNILLLKYQLEKWNCASEKERKFLLAGVLMGLGFLQLTPLKC